MAHFWAIFFQYAIKKTASETHHQVYNHSRLKFGRPHNNPNDSIEQTKDYFERRLPTQKLDALFDCQKSEQAYVVNDNLIRLNWQKLPYTDEVLALICQNHNQKNTPNERVFEPC